MQAKSKSHILFSLFIALFLISKVGLIFGQNLQKLDSLEESLIFSESTKEKINILNQLTKEHITSDPDKAFIYAEQALQIAEHNKDKEGELMSLLNLADIYQVKTDLKNSISFALRAKELAGKIDKPLAYAEANMILSNCFRQIGEFGKGSEVCFEALEIFEQYNDVDGQCNALNAIGIFYNNQEIYDKALSFFERSYKIALEKDNLRGISRSLNNISVVASNTGDREKSIEYLHKAIEINKTSGQKQWLGVNYNNLSEEFLDIGELDSVYNYVYKAIEIGEELENNFNLAASYILLSKYYKQKGNETLFLEHINKALELGEAHNLRNIVLEISGILNDYYFEKENYKEAYRYKSLQSALNDSLDNENSLTRLGQLNLLYNMEKNEQLRKLKAQRKDFVNIIIISGLVAGIIIILLILFRYRIKSKYNKLEKEKLQDDLEFRNKELAANVMSLMQKNEILTDITRKLVELEKHAVKGETKKALTSIAHDIDSIAQESIWNEFEIRFKQVHSAFYERLIHRFPDLSPNEQRLCAFLKLNLNTKEISSISGQSNRAIEMARFRLRKKLGISTQDVNLVNFIAQI